MMISTKGRYALRVMLDLAEQEAGVFVPLRDIAKRQEISQKYLESIMTLLSKASLVDSLHGKGGGYRLNRSPSSYTLGSLLKVTEGTLVPVACLEDSSSPCDRAAICKTLPVWQTLNGLIDDYLEGVTLADIM